MKRRELMGVLSGLPVAASSAAAATDSTAGKSVLVASPDSRIRVEFGLYDKSDKRSVACYSVFFRGNALIRRASLGMQLAPDGPFGSDLRIVRFARHQKDDTYKIYPGKTSVARDHYCEAVVSLEEGKGPRRRLDLIFRVYNDGIAFRYRIPEQPALSDLTITAEHSTFAFVGNPLAYTLPVPSFTTPYEVYYRPIPLRNVSPDPLLALPLLLEYPGQMWAAITEADLNNYAGMYVSGTADSPGVITSRLSPRPDDPQIKVRANLPHVSPWRVLMIADDPGRLIESNLITNLNPPCALADTSWIKPGKTTFPWWNGYEVGNAGFRGGQNTQTHKYYIDFCAEAGIEYHSLDGLDNVAWYGGPIRPYRGADITQSVPEIDLPEVIAYAKQKGVRLRLWMNSAAAQAQMRRAFPIYEQWGIEGVMVDFFERDDQEMVNFFHELVQLAAKHHLTVTLHNISKPTGLRRTYPNLMTIESVFNAEYNKWHAQGSTPEHELTVPFARMLAGPVDYHSGSFHNVTQQEYKPRNVAPVTIGTRTRELARYVVYEGYLPMVADYPAAYRNQPGLEFLSQVPTFWDETRVLNSAVGKYITVARRHGSRWYVGSMSDGGARELSIPLNFVGAGSFVAEIYSDDLNAPAQPEKLIFQRLEATASDTIRAALAAAGGHVIRLTPVRQRL